MPTISRPVALALLLCVAATGCGSRRQTLAIAAFSTDPNVTTGRRVPEGGAIGDPHSLVRFVGATAEPCHVVVLSIGRPMRAERMDSLEADAPPIPVSAGEFRIQGNWSYPPEPGVLRIFAFCGRSDLRYESVALAVEGQLQSALTTGTIAGALRTFDHVEGLPPGVEQATALFRLIP